MLIGLGLSGCNLRPDRNKEGAPKGATAKPRSAAIQVAAKASGSAQQPTARSASGQLKLSSGALLVLPKNAKVTKPPPVLPAGIKKVHAYRLGQARQTLLVNELERGSKPCAELMAEQQKKLQAAQQDTNEARLNFRKMGKVEAVAAGSRRVLYAESQQRGLPPKNGEPRPMVAMASALMCTPTDFVVVMYASKQDKLKVDIKSMLTALLASYRKGS